MLGQLIMQGRERRLSLQMGNSEWYHKMLFRFLHNSLAHWEVVTLTWHVQGTMKLSRLAKSLAADVNVKRKSKGLLPRAVSCYNFSEPFIYDNILCSYLLQFDTIFLRVPHSYIIPFYWIQIVLLGLHLCITEIRLGWRNFRDTILSHSLETLKTTLSAEYF